MKTKITLLIALFISIASLKAQTFTIGDFTYKSLVTNPKSVQITSAVCKDIVTIPATVSYQGDTYKVTRINTDVYKNCTTLTQITLPNSLKQIGSSAFSGCINLTNLVLPSSLESISTFSFSGCDSLTEIVIPNSVSTIKERAFQSCENLTDVTLSENLEIINEAVFRFCKKLKSINIPDNITSIGQDAFENCNVLESINFNSSSKLSEIKSGAFQSCTSLQNFIIPNVSIVGDYAFRGCSTITEINLPNSITSLGKEVFSFCSSLLAFFLLTDTVYCY